MTLLERRVRNFINWIRSPRLIYQTSFQLKLPENGNNHGQVRLVFFNFLFSFQDLVIPKESAPNTLKRVFQYLAHTVKSDLIAECTIEQLTNYRPLTFSPELIRQETTKIDANDWHAANLMIFQNLANLLYGISLEFCDPSCCPIMTVGKG